MICTKCNSEIPNGAKFCPVCGNACGTASDVKPAGAFPETEAKTYCGKCGLELNRGAKFCAVCGAPAAVGDIKSTVNDGSTFGSGDMSAVSLDKPSASDSLVAAMNTASAPSAVPTPSNSVPTPSNSGSGAFSGFGGTNSGYGSSVPSFIPESPAPGNMTDPFGASADPFGDMGAAAIVATPIKKRTGLKVGIIIASVFAVLIAAAAVFFFTNKATALSLIMGKSNYAAMVEGNSIKEAAEKLDVPALSDGIKSASGLVASLASMNEGYVGSFDGMSNIDSEFNAAPMMSHTDGAIDFEALISAYYEAMMNTYGMNSVKADVSVNASISDSVKSMLGEDADEIIELFNALNMSADFTVSKDSVSARMDMSSGSDVINVKTIFTADGEIYLALPFVGDKALKVKIPSEKSAQTMDIKPLELDAKELERLIGEMVEIYVKEYKESAIEMGDGELTAAGLTAKGKLITARFTGEQLLAICQKMAEHFANDAYFRSKVIEFANEYGAELTEQEYIDEISNMFSEDDLDTGDDLIIKTVIDNNGNILAKSYVIVNNGDEDVSLTYIDSKKQFTLEMIVFDEPVFSAVCDIVSDTEGSAELRFMGDDGMMTVKADYSDIGTAKFCGRDTFTGSFTIGLEVPADFTEDLSVLSGMKFTVSTSVTGENTMESTVGASVGNYGSVTLKSTVTASNNDAALALPTDVIDLGNGEDQPDEATLTALMEYIESIGKKLEEMKDGPFGGIYDGLVENIIGNGGGSFGDISYGKVDFDEVMALTNDISQTMTEVMNFPAQYRVYEDTLNERANDIQDELDDLYSDIVNKDWELTKAEFTEYTNKYNAIKAKADALEADYEKLMAANPVTPINPSGSSAEDLDFDNMSDNDLYDVLDEYANRYIAIFADYNNTTKIFSDEELTKLSTAAGDAYDKAADDYTQFIDTYVGGNYSVALLRNARKSTKAFAFAVEELEKALMAEA